MKAFKKTKNTFEVRSQNGLPYVPVGLNVWASIVDGSIVNGDPCHHLGYVTPRVSRR